MIMSLEFNCIEPLYKIGQFAGSFLFLILIKRTNQKSMLVFFLIIKAFCLFAFTNNYITNIHPYIALCLRFISGISYTVIMLYLPIWNQRIGLYKYRRFFNTWIILSVPIGKSFSFLYSYYISYINWQFCFQTESCIIALIVLFILLIHKAYFSSKIYYKQTNEGNEVLRNSQYSNITVFSIRKSNTSNASNNKIQCSLLCNKIYICAMLSKTIIIGVSSVLVFYMQSNLRIIYSVKEESYIAYYSCLMVLIPPVIAGVFISSLNVISMKIYSKICFIIVLLIIGLLSMTFVLCFFNNSLLYMVSTSVYRLMSNCSNPLLTELIFDSLSSNKDTFNFGYTINTLINTSLGSFLMPIVYHLLGQNKLSLLYISLYGYFSIVFLLITFCNRTQKEKQEPILPKEKTEKRKQSINSEAMDDLSVNVKVNIAETNEDIDSENDDNVYKLNDIKNIN